MNAPERKIRKQSIIRRLLSRKILQRYIFALVCFVTVIATVYAVENWRGKRAWMAYKRNLEAKGAMLDWSAFVPPPVPDEQNIFKAPHMEEWFLTNPLVGYQKDEAFLAKLNARKLLDEPWTVARITLTSTNEAVLDDKISASFVYGSPLSPDARATLQDLLNKSLDERLQPDDIMLAAAEGFFLTSGRIERPEVLNILIQADKTLEATEVQEFLFPPGSGFLVKASGTNTYHIQRPVKQTVLAAGDYLRWSDQFEMEFSQIRTALQRPYARIDDNYQTPLMQPVPNAVSIRLMAWALSQRAQCYLLLNEPEKALRELTFLLDLRSLLLMKPSGKPIALMASLIDGAVCGIYASVISDGFKLGAWTEPQLNAIRRQLVMIQQEARFPDQVIRSLQYERAASIHWMLNSGTREIDSILTSENDLLKEIHYGLKFAPRGWSYQNAMLAAQLFQEQIDSLNSRSIKPESVQVLSESQTMRLRRLTPSTFITRLVVPGFESIIETATRRETVIAQAIIACALEQYRLKHNEYPDALQALVPDFLEAIPNDLIGGQPMKYFRTGDGKFLLYSIGWDEKDDGGKPSKNRREKGDWVWGSSIM